MCVKMATDKLIRSSVESQGCDEFTTSLGECYSPSLGETLNSLAGSDPLNSEHCFVL